MHKLFIQKKKEKEQNEVETEKGQLVLPSGAISTASASSPVVLGALSVVTP